MDDILCDRLVAYLAGPLTGVSSDDQALCRAIRTSSRTVLSARFRVYDPADYTAPGSSHTADDVFAKDHARTTTSDLVFFHLISPSLGVGIESQLAADATIPRVVAYPKGRQVSRMFEGLFNPTVARIEYLDANDFEQQLRHHLPAIARSTQISSSKRRPILAHIKNGRCGEEMFKSRVLLKLGLPELAAATDIKECMLRRLEQDNTVAATITCVQLTRLAGELKATVSLDVKGGPTLHGPTGEPDVPDVQVRSLNTLYECLKARRQSWLPDKTIFSAWDYAFPNIGAGEIQAARGSDPTVQQIHVTVDQWQEIFESLAKDTDDPQLFA